MNLKLKEISKLMVLVLLITFGAIGCRVDNKPEVKLTAEIIQLNDEDFDGVGTTGITNPKKSDFRQFKFTLKVEKLKKITERTIVVPQLEAGINSHDNKHRLWFGSSAEQDNASEDFAFYERKYMLFTRGLTDVDLRKMFENEIVKISWKTDKGEVVTKQYDVGKTIRFK